jgi:hypothetical protein
MESKKFNSIAGKVKKWAKGKADNDFQLFYIPAQKRLEDYLEDNLEASNEIMKLVKLNRALETVSWWNYHKFLDLQLNSGTAHVEKFNSYLFEAVRFRILVNALGFTKPENIGPVHEGPFACSICDAILLDDKLTDNLIVGFNDSLIY